jgi:two-component system sensor histidine kinase KdpD
VPIVNRSRAHAIGGGVLGVLIVFAITWFCASVARVNATTAGFAYLIVVLAVATTRGLWEAVAVSVVAMLCFNFFFFPPVGQLTIADPQNWVALFTFLVTALVASHLSNRAKRQAVEARERQRETEQLYAFSRSILLTDASKPIGFEVARSIAETFDCPAVALYDASANVVYKGGNSDLDQVDQALRQIAMEGTTLSGADEVTTPIRLGGQPIGALALKGLRCSDGALQALANLVAIALEKARSAEVASKAEAARQSEEFKSTLLDAIAHEFKTPLTSIKAAATSMLSPGSGLPPALDDLAQVIDEESDRLGKLVTEAVRMSEIEAGKVRLDRKPEAVGAVIEEVVAGFGSQLEDRQLELHIADGLPQVSIDRGLIVLALRQLVDNALKYSPAASPIRIGCGREGNSVWIMVADEGPGVPARERERIFERYYRRNLSRGQVPGTGLGLHIAREIARAHGGDLWAEGADGDGATLRLLLPVNAGYQEGSTA